MFAEEVERFEKSSYFKLFIVRDSMSYLRQNLAQVPTM